MAPSSEKVRTVVPDDLIEILFGEKDAYGGCVPSCHPYAGCPACEHSRNMKRAVRETKKEIKKTFQEGPTGDA